MLCNKLDNEQRHYLSDRLHCICDQKEQALWKEVGEKPQLNDFANKIKLKSYQDIIKLVKPKLSVSQGHHIGFHISDIIQPCPEFDRALKQFNEKYKEIEVRVIGLNKEWMKVKDIIVLGDSDIIEVLRDFESKKF